jgi:hypothetical protein
MAALFAGLPRTSTLLAILVFDPLHGPPRFERIAQGMGVVEPPRPAH